MSRARLLVGAALLATATPAAALPPGGPGRVPVCTNTWSAIICADETFTGTNTHEYLSASVAGPIQSSFPALDGAFVQIGGADDADVSGNLSLDSGGGAAAGLVDIQRLVNNKGDAGAGIIADLLTLQSACGGGGASSQACADAKKKLSGEISQDDLQNASLWGRGCKHASDTATRSSTHLNNRYLAAFAAVSDNGSSASITLDVLHRGSRTVTQNICVPCAHGSLPPNGPYENKVLGSCKNAIAPQHGGTLANIQVVITGGLKADGGTFSANPPSPAPGATVEILFSGDIGPCNFTPAPPPPKPIP
jgi:hypothetical protein